jgi:hypothetical protein
MITMEKLMSKRRILKIIRAPSNTNHKIRMHLIIIVILREVSR